MRPKEVEVDETTVRQPDEPCKCNKVLLKPWWASITDAGNEGTDYVKHTRESCLTRTERENARYKSFPEQCIEALKAELARALAAVTDVPETSGKERAEAWVRERSQSTTGGRLYLSENDMVSLAALLDGPPKPHEVPYAVEQKRQRVLSALWRVAEASRVLQANVGRTTGPMWDALDRSLYALDHDREAH